MPLTPPLLCAPVQVLCGLGWFADNVKHTRWFFDLFTGCINNVATSIPLFLTKSRKRLSMILLALHPSTDVAAGKGLNPSWSLGSKTKKEAQKCDRHTYRTRR